MNGEGSVVRPKKKNMLPLRRPNIFFPILVPQHFFSYFYQNSGNPLGNSQKILGIPKISREFPEILGNSPIFKKKKEKRKNAPAPTFLFFAQR